MSASYGSTWLAEADTSEPSEQLSISRSVLLHLAPGACIALFYGLALPNVVAQGLPPLYALLLAVLFVAIPLELGELLRQGRARNGRFSLRGVVLYRRPMPAWQYLVIALGFLIFAALASGAVMLFEAGVGQHLWAWFPRWLMLTDQPNAYLGYSRSALYVTFGLTVLLNWFVAPAVEELYFRGYLLPRLSRLGVGAPVLNACLFAMYHFWQPYAYLSIAVVFVPVALLVWWKRNLYLGILLHCMLNVVGNLILFVGVLGR